MIASEIPSVIESFIKEENPYHCILIDGAWGIGKSFQIDKALKEIPCSISISLFGITTVDEIMTQLAVRIREGNYNSLFDFLKKADSVYIWSEVLNLETHDIERMVSEEVPKEYEKLLSQKGRKLDFTLSSIFSDEIQSSQMKSFLTNFGEKEMAIYVKWLKKQFQSSLESGDYTKIYQQLDEIEMIFQKLQRKGQTNVIVETAENSV